MECNLGSIRDFLIVVDALCFFHECGTFHFLKLFKEYIWKDGQNLLFRIGGIKPADLAPILCHIYSLAEARAFTGSEK